MPRVDLQALWRHRFLRFLVVGGLNTAFAYGSYAALLALGWPYAAASAGSLLLGLLFSFFTQGRLVFGNGELRQLPRFVACWLLLYALNVGVIAGLVRLGLGPYAAGALALVPMAVGSYLVQRHLVFGVGRERASSAGLTRK